MLECSMLMGHFMRHICELRLCAIDDVVFSCTFFHYAIKDVTFERFFLSPSYISMHA